MHERELYDRILGLSVPLFGSDEKLITESQQVDVFVEHAQRTAFCCRYENQASKEPRCFYPP